MTGVPPAEGGPDGAPRRRRHRRATGGVAPQPDAPAGAGAAAEPVVPRRSADDEDTGWGETSSGNDERLLRDVPPHW